MPEPKRGMLNARIEYRCTSEEKSRLREIARSRGQSVSGLITEGIRIALVEAKHLGKRTVTKTVHVPDYGLVVAVNRIGNNLNQIAHGINESLACGECPNWARVETMLMLIHSDLFCILELAESFANLDAKEREEMKGIFAYLARKPNIVSEILGLMEREQTP